MGTFCWAMLTCLESLGLLLDEPGQPVEPCGHRVPRMVASPAGSNLTTCLLTLAVIGVCSEEMARTFNCGLGMVLVVAADKVTEVIALIPGGEARQVGRLVAQKEASTILRTRLNPLLCRPEEGRPTSTSPSATSSVRGSMLPLSTAPTVKPARSYSPPAYIPGISAVSPPVWEELVAS
ncbi:Phosphoribosylformylglycinamidine cyclo-ligase [Portunus trituberculatus]|uniref:Phosphoribosylformylglycinamidine cyclo-ligase n=1 Tax=Portunus trituberculatus TaxID=210409 RepID=A0A5B7EQ54_PORTR|nr:Phosphoribosylformylglycinamidine cyclo-ligase [Portunus trituberculatus]